MSSRFPGGHCNTGTGHTPVTGTHPTQLGPLDRACWTPVPVSTNAIAPGALNPIAVPIATVTGWVSSAQRTRLRAPSGVAPALGSSPASFMLILDEPIRRVNTLTVMSFQTAGRVWAITPDRHTNTLCMTPRSCEPPPLCGPACPTSATCCCGTTADCAGLSHSDCEDDECGDCEWSDGKCGTAWTTLCAPPMANPTLRQVLGWLQRQTPLGWEWVISPDGLHAGVRAVAISTGPYASADSSCPLPLTTQSFVVPSSDLQICFGGDRPLNPSLGWILGFRDRCYRFPAPAAAETLHLSCAHFYGTASPGPIAVQLDWECAIGSALFVQTNRYILHPLRYLVAPAVYAVVDDTASTVVVGYLVAQRFGSKWQYKSTATPPSSPAGWEPGYYYWAFLPGPTEPTPSQLTYLQNGYAHDGGTLKNLARVERLARTAADGALPAHYAITFSTKIQFTTDAFTNTTAELSTPHYTLAGTRKEAPETTSSTEALAWALPSLFECPTCPPSTCGPTVYQHTEPPLRVTRLSAQILGTTTTVSASPADLAATAKPLLSPGTSVAFALSETNAPAQSCDKKFGGNEELVAITRRPASPVSLTATTATPAPLHAADFGLTPPPCPYVTTPPVINCPAQYAEGVFSLWGEQPPFTLCIDDYQSRGAPGQSTNSSLSGGGTTPANAIGALSTTSVPGELTLAAESPTRTYTGLTTVSRLGISIVGPDGRPVNLIDDFAIQLQFTTSYDPA